ncbi:MAG: Hsp20/alpha crystallin family protein [Candidatus Eisenbacteria bacterium]
MTLIRWNPVAPTRDLARVQDEMDRLFNSILDRGSFGGALAPAFAPAVDIEETPEAFVFRADLPGIKLEDVKVNLMGDTLMIRGERKQETADKKGNVHRVERVYGVFERTFELGKRVHGDQVKASYKDGVLEVRVPKAEDARVREIPVQVG